MTTASQYRRYRPSHREQQRTVGIRAGSADAKAGIEHMAYRLHATGGWLAESEGFRSGYDFGWHYTLYGPGKNEQ